MKKTLVLTVTLEFTDDITGQETGIIDEIGLMIQHKVEDAGLTDDDSEAATASIAVGEAGSEEPHFTRSFPVFAAL